MSLESSLGTKECHIDRDKMKELIKKNLCTQQSQRKYMFLEVKIVIEEQVSKDAAVVVHGQDMVQNRYLN